MNETKRPHPLHERNETISRLGHLTFHIGLTPNLRLGSLQGLLRLIQNFGLTASPHHLLHCMLLHISLKSPGHPFWMGWWGYAKRQEFTIVDLFAPL